MKLVVSLVLGAVLALVGAALASWQAWEAVSPLPTAAQFAEIGRVVSPGNPGPFAAADPVRDDVADTGTVVPVTAYGPGVVPPGNRSLDSVRDRLKDAGWDVTDESHADDDRYVVAEKGHLRVFVTDEYWSSGGESGGGIFVKVLRASTWPVVAAGVLGAVAGAALAWVLVGWGARRTAGRPVRRGVVLLLTGVALVLLVPGIAWTLYRALPDGVTMAHNYVQEPFWRGLTGEPRAVPALYPAACALLVLLIPTRFRRQQSLALQGG